MPLLQQQAPLGLNAALASRDGRRVYGVVVCVHVVMPVSAPVSSDRSALIFTVSIGTHTHLFNASLHLTPDR